MSARQQWAAEAELCEVFDQPEPGAQRWLLNYSAVVFCFKAAEVSPMAQPVKRCSGGGSWSWLWTVLLLKARFSIRERSVLGPLSWAVRKCVGGISAVCLNLCWGLHLPLYPF